MSTPNIYRKHWLFILPILSIFLYACPIYTTEPMAPETSYTPLFMTRAQLESSVKSITSQKLLEPGKMLVYQNYIFLVEKYQGVHVIDNSNPAVPTKVSFIRVPGCIDIASKDNFLFVDNAVDLVTLNISNVTQITVVSRQRDAFPELYPPDLGYLPYIYRVSNREEGLIIVGWEK